MQLGDFIEDAKSSTISSYLQGMKKNFINERYDVGQNVERELDFFLGLVMDQIYQKFSFLVIEII